MSEQNERAAELEVIQSNVQMTAQDVVRGGSGFASTIDLSTPEAKLDVLNALSDPEALSDNEGVVIPVRGVLAQATKFRDASGALIDGIATYIVGRDGKTYISVSTGIAAAIQKFIGVFGADPANWPAGLMFTPIKKNIGGGKTTWTIKTHTEKSAK